MAIKPGITEDGFRTAVRDYTEPTVVEELVANSYDADARIALVLLDPTHRHLLVIDDGNGFSKASITEVATLGAGDKQNLYSDSGRPYLGSYGYGTKSSLNIASKMNIRSCSAEGEFQTTIDWSILGKALKPGFPGYELKMHKRRRACNTGTQIKLFLKNPTSKSHLDRFADVLSNLPNDRGKFVCYTGMYQVVAPDLRKALANFRPLKAAAGKLERKGLLRRAGTSRDVELSQCTRTKLTDKEDRSVKATFYFAGYAGDKVRSLKPGLRGIYIRIHGRLLKKSFTEREYTYPISRWVKFENGLRIELEIDWLRDQITLSREGVRFSSEKLEKLFKAVLTRLASRFIKPELKKLAKKRARRASLKHRQRMELVRNRVKGKKGVKVPGLTAGFSFLPETDGELALVMAQDKMIRKIDKNFRLADYNDQAPFDCVIYDKGRRDFIFTELEPTLPDFLDHKDKSDVELIITWTTGKWRIGARKRGRGGHFELVQSQSKKKGRYKLLEYAGPSSKSPRNHIDVVVLEELLR